MTKTRVTVEIFHDDGTVETLVSEHGISTEGPSPDPVIEEEDLVVPEAALKLVGIGANIYDTRQNSGGLWTAPGAAIAGEVCRRITELKNRGSKWARLCLEAYADTHPVMQHNPLHYQDMFNPGGEAYRADIVTIMEHAANENFNLMICPWESPHVPRNALGSGTPIASANQWWESFVELTKGYDHIVYDLANEPEDNFNGSEDDARSARFLELVNVIRAKEVELGSVRHDISLPGLGAWARRVDAWATRLPADTDGLWIKGHVYDAFTNDTNAFNRLTTALAAHPRVVIGEFGPASGFMSLEDCDRLVDWCNQNGVPAAAWAYAHRDNIAMLVENAGGAGIGQNLNALTTWGTRFMGYLQ